MIEKLVKIMQKLYEEQIYTSIKFDGEQPYLDLETDAKSHLHLYSDGRIKGRYSYEKVLDLGNDDIITVLCHEFVNALHGRNYCQSGWAVLCENKGIKLKMYG